jgi:hypothetical protein
VPNSAFCSVRPLFLVLSEQCSVPNFALLLSF